MEFNARGENPRSEYLTEELQLAFAAGPKYGILRNKGRALLVTPPKHRAI